MTELEDMLRTALHEKAERIPDQAPALDLESAHPVRNIRRTRSRADRVWLLPVAAAVAVLAVVASTVVTSRVLSGTGGSSATAALSGVPRYYVTLTGKTAYPSAVVRETKTGAVVARIDAPRPYRGFTEVTGAANDRTFVLTAQEAAGRAIPSPLPAYRFYLLHIDPAAASAADRARLTPLRLPIPHNTQTSAMALSPDGRSLATVTINQVGALTRLIVYNLVARTRRTWTNPSCSSWFCIGTDLGGPENTDTLSWTADGHTLAVVVVGGGIDSALRLLDIRARSGNLIADSRLVPLHGAPALPGRPGETRLDGQWRVVQISPDGRSVFLGVQYLTYHESLMRFSVRTGALMSVLNNLSTGPRRTWEQLLWSNSSGRLLILTGIRPGGTAGIVGGGHYTPIPWSRSFQDAAW